MTNSMTGFASAKGAMPGWSWAWEMRSVNARGLDIRLRLPDWIDGLEQAIRPKVQSAVARGNVSLTLKVQADLSVDRGAINGEALDQALDAIARVEAVAQSRGMILASTQASDILALRGVTDSAAANDDTTELSKALLADLPDLLADFTAMRAAEGAELKKILTAQIKAIDAMTKDAGKAAETRKSAIRDALKKNLAAVMDNAQGADEDRVAQELALIAVKADITEELDRLRAHVVAARDLLGTSGPVGRKLDFLTQEFNREANTLCSKAQSNELTKIGLDLKAAIDQMREQVQNVE